MCGEKMILEFIKFFILSILIVLITKYILIKIIRNLAKLMKLKPKTVGIIAGASTSIPELLTVSFSAFSRLIGTSIFNILSSNIINFLQYFVSICLNKNISKLNNKAVKIDLLLVIFTILIPTFLIIFNIEYETYTIPIFIILFYIFYRISKNAHKIYLVEKEEKKEEKIEKINKYDRIKIGKHKFIKHKSIILNIMFLLLTGVLIYFLGDLLGDTLENLCNILKIPQFIIGILLGIITSIPELVTFFESQKHHSKETDEGIIEATSNLLFSNLINIFVIQTIGLIIFLVFS